MIIPSETDVDRVLERDPRDILALVAKGDYRERAGEERIAVNFYRAALKAASAGPVDIELKPYLTHAQAALARASASFERHLEDALTTAGFPRGSRPARFERSIDILTGRVPAPALLQRPTGYLYPGLPERRYFERSEFPWAGAMEAMAEAIRAELAQLLAQSPERFTPYIVNERERRPQDVHGLIDNPDWSTLHLWQDGRVVEANAERCPRTIEAITRSGIDLPMIGARAPCVMFSRLRPGAHIPPHTGMINARLICHLPLIVPPGCGFRVGGETREWREGELLVFDDTVEHEAWNHGEEDRFLLIFDTWHPALDDAERRAITALFAAVDAY